LSPRVLKANATNAFAERKRSLLDLAYIQARLAEDGTLIRGATTIGDIYVNDRLIFGPALIRAYELERGVASYPRIILDSRVFDRLADSAELRMPGVTDQVKSLSTVLARDNDGTCLSTIFRPQSTSSRPGQRITQNFSANTGTS